MGVIEEVLRIRDEATPALRALAAEADKAAEAVKRTGLSNDSVTDSLKAFKARLGESRKGMEELKAEVAAGVGKYGQYLAAVTGVAAGLGVVVGAATAAWKVFGDLAAAADQQADTFERLGTITKEQAAGIKVAAASQREFGLVVDTVKAKLVAAGSEGFQHFTTGLSAVTLALSGVPWEEVKRQLREIKEEAADVGAEWRLLADQVRTAFGTDDPTARVFAGFGSYSAKELEIAKKGIERIDEGLKKAAESARLLAAEYKKFQDERGRAIVDEFDAIALEASQRADAAALLAQGAQSGTTITDGIPAGAAGGFGFGSSSTQATGAERAQAAFDRIATVGDKTFDLLNAILPPLAESMGPEGKLVLLLLQLAQGFLGGAANGGGFAGGFTGAGEALAGVGVQLAASAASSGFKSRSSGPSFSRGSGATSGRNQRAARDLARSGGGDTYYISGVIASDLDDFERKLERNRGRRGSP